MRIRAIFWIGLALGLGALAAFGKRRAAEAAKRRHQEELLDDALTQTFPASDPVSLY